MAVAHMAFGWVTFRRWAAVEPAAALGSSGTGRRRPERVLEMNMGVGGFGAGAAGEMGPDGYEAGRYVLAASIPRKPSLVEQREMESSKVC